MVDVLRRITWYVFVMSSMLPLLGISVNGNNGGGISYFSPRSLAMMFHGVLILRFESLFIILLLLLLLFAGTSVFSYLQRSFFFSFFLSFFFFFFFFWGGGKLSVCVWTSVFSDFPC